MEHPTELLSNIDIKNLSKIFKINLIDCCFKEDLKNLKTGSYVINLGDFKKLGGTHWTALYIDKNKNAIYYDSFGETCPNQVIKECKKKNIKLKINMFRNQQLNGTECGYWCLAFLHWMTKYKQATQYNLNIFNKPFHTEKTENNLLILKKYIKSIVEK